VAFQRDADALLGGLTPAQCRAVTSDAAPICVVASAGSGKTRVLTRRIAYRAMTGSAVAQHAMALTFTRKAAGEMQERLARLGLRERVAAGTFHSLAYGQLQRWWADRGQRPPALLERKGRLLGPLAAERPATRATPVFELAGHIEWAKARMISPDAFEEVAGQSRRVLPSGVRPAEVAALYARYEHEKARRGLVDFDDILARGAEAIERDSSFAAAQRWRWRHVYVDEFQDLNPLQHRLLLAWLGASTDLFVVGDPNQAIYGWNGADSDLLTEVPVRWPTTEVIRLDANHRCTEQIVVAASAVLGSAGVQLRSTGRMGPRPHIADYASERAEAMGIAAAVVRAHAGGARWSDLAVLARTNAQLVPIQKAFADALVPHWAPSQAGLLDDPVVRRFVKGLDNPAHTPIQVVVADLEEAAGEEEGLDDAGRGALESLLELARTFAGQDSRASASSWIAWLPSATKEAAFGPRTGDQVALCTFHRAKGLEWQEVWVAGLEQGLVPIGSATTQAEQEEERRLLYVGLTRASDRIHCSWCRQRTFGTRTVPRTPSPWLQLIDRRAVPTSGHSWRETLSEQRRALREASRRDRHKMHLARPPGWPEPDEDLVAAIRDWRLETARASGVPAYVVLHDATVDALACLRPRTTEELLAVPGLGPVKANRYGPSILSLIAASVGRAPRHSA
jgi:DNA helicase-2/ATP-dependent DNA helicase PcrA